MKSLKFARGLLLTFVLIECRGGAGRESSSAVEQRVFAAINQQRRANGSPPLQWDEKAAAVAREHSLNMVRRGFFAHKDPLFGDLGDRLHRASIYWTGCAENIYQERGMGEPADAAVAGWMSSPGHRRNALSRLFTHTGVGVFAMPDGMVTFTQVFVKY